MGKCSFIPLAITAMAAALSAVATKADAEQPARETFSFPREYRGKPIQVGGVLILPPGTGKVPAMVIHHGSGGVTESREFRYAREMVAMGVAAFVIDSFKPRGITNTVSDQSQVSTQGVTEDALFALKEPLNNPPNMAH